MSMTTEATIASISEKPRSRVRGGPDAFAVRDHWIVTASEEPVAATMAKSMIPVAEPETPPSCKTSAS